MYLISKILMNSLYGKFGIQFELPSYKLYHKDECDLEIYEDLGLDFVLGYKNNDNKTTLNNVAIASAITALARVHMSQFKNAEDYNLYYTDTDSVIIDQPLPDSLTGKILGKMTLENVYSKFITFAGSATKFYGGITLGPEAGQEIIKIKGLSHEV